MHPAAPDPRVRVLALVKGLGVGGAEQLLWWQTMLSDSTSVAIDVAYLVPWKDALVESLEAAGGEVFCLSAAKERQLGWVVRLRRLLAAGQYDVVHLHSPYVAAVARIVVRSLPRHRRPAVVSTEHNVWPRFTWPTRVANAVTFPIGDAWFAVSDAVKQSIPSIARDRVEVLVHGVPQDGIAEARAAREEVRAELGLHADDIAVITVANFRAQKAYPDLLRAARRAVDANARLRFFSVGQGQLEHVARQVHAELDLGDRFQFLGYRSDALRLVAASDIFALASEYEGYPIAVMEALSVGVPVVATRVGGIPDAVTDGIEGFLVAPGAIEQLADAIVRIAGDDGLREQMGTAAARRGRDFDMKRAAGRLDDVYSALAKR